MGQLISITDFLTILAFSKEWNTNLKKSTKLCTFPIHYSENTGAAVHIMSLEWKIRDSENFGKGVFAARTIEKCTMKSILSIYLLFIVLYFIGCKLVQVQSEINVLEDFAIKDYCSNCLKHSANLYPCPSCSVMKYCSSECIVNLEYFLSRTIVL